MPAPSAHLERTRGRILGGSELVRAVSRVRLLEGIAEPGGRRRRTTLLALTEQRLIVVTPSWRSGRSRLLAEWPVDGLKILVVRPKIGNHLIEIATGAKTLLRAEWIDGAEPSVWAGLRYRLMNPVRSPHRSPHTPAHAIVSPPDTESV